MIVRSAHLRLMVYVSFVKKYIVDKEVMRDV